MNRVITSQSDVVFADGELNLPDRQNDGYTITVCTKNGVDILFEGIKITSLPQNSTEKLFWIDGSWTIAIDQPSLDIRVFDFDSNDSGTNVLRTIAASHIIVEANLSVIESFSPGSTASFGVLSRPSLLSVPIDFTGSFLLQEEYRTPVDDVIILSVNSTGSSGNAFLSYEVF